MIAVDNLRSVRVYDEWETDAMFDALWVSDQTCRAYVNMYSERRGMSADAKREMLAAELEKCNKNVLFYLLADVRDRFHPLLSDKDPSWTMYLEVNGQKILPEKDGINVVELSSEMLRFFGHRHAKPKFKTVYEVKFPIADGAGNRYITAGKPFKLVLGSVKKSCILGWQGGQPVLVTDVSKDCSKTRKLIKDEDFYWL